MAYDNEQNDIPIGPNEDGENRTSLSHLPKYFRTPANKKFLTSTLDQLTNPGEVEKLNSYYGRRDAKAVKADDNYISDVSSDRENYQVEPAVVLKDDTGNVDFYKDYNDYINQLRAFGNKNPDHSKINAQEYYAWQPHIDWDKFVNFREYYWLPAGPQVLPIFGQNKEIVSTFKVSIEENDDNVAYKFTPTGLTQNPTLKLYKGQTYIFEIDTPGHPIAFATNRAFTPGQAIITETVEGVLASGKFEAELYDTDGYDTGEYIVEPVEGGITGFQDGDNISTIYTDGVESATVYVEKGTLKFTVPLDAPDTLFYISQNDVNTSGLVTLYNILENTEIDVEKEILQKLTYTTRTDTDLSNGMLVEFLGDVTPAKYSEGYWYVEGVGESIQLINKADLEITGAYSSNIFVPFDTENFDKLPFGQALNYPKEQDYITINRASIDGNQWSRHNRWFHKDTIEKTALANNTPVALDQAQRASRPIVEFNAGLRLYNFGSEKKTNVDLVDDFTGDVFSIIEGSTGYNVDGVELTDGLRVLFTADPDIRVNGRIYKVKFINHLGTRQIALQEETDTTPLENQTVLVAGGTVNAGKIYWYNGTKWIKAQDKTKTNQEPKFNLYDIDDVSFDTYTANTFTGTKLFSYKQGTGVNDTVLGFPLTYRNIENSGDIVFNFDLLTDTFTYQIGQSDYTQKTDESTLRKYTGLNTYTNESGWEKAETESKQKVVRQYIIDGQKNNFAIDVYDKSGDLNNLDVQVYVNNERQTAWTLNRENSVAYVNFTTKLKNGDVLVIHTTSEADKNANGKYEFPINLQNNPLNENISNFTYGEVTDHVSTIISNVSGFTGTFPGPSNLRNLGGLAKLGTKFVQHSGAIPLALYHITSKNYNMVKAIRFARKEYAKFKRAVVDIAENLGLDGSAQFLADKVIEKWQSEKSKQTSFYWTDMIGSGANTKRNFVVTDTGNKFYSLTTPFTLSTISASAVYVYHNNVQLLHGQDYTFTTEGFIKIDSDYVLAVNDTITIYEYESTDASFIPPTPSKLGLYPLHKPVIFTDNTYSTPRVLIKGHDGSLVKAYNDYRDDVILEIEKRIYNNVKVTYDSNIFDIDSFVGHKTRDTGFTRTQEQEVIITDFVEWLNIAGDPDYTDISFYDRANPFTWNYSKLTDPYGNPLPGYWRGIYKEYLSTDTPHTTPWKILGYVDQPTWWETVYGPAPYTKENLILWEDLEKGLVRQPNNPIRYRTNYKRKDLSKYIPVDTQGNLISPYDSGYAQGLIVPETDESFVFGDESPVETAWRRSAEYPFSLLTAFLIHQPAKVIGIGYDRSRTKRNPAGGLVYSETNRRLEPKGVVFPNTSEDTTRVTTAGLINYIFNYINADVTKLNVDYNSNVNNINVQLGFKIGGFSTKDKFKLLLDSRTPNNKGNVFVPEENYKIFLNTSSPIDTVSYSGVIVEKRSAGFIIKGYDKSKPYFDYYKHIERAKDPVVNVGGVSENFLEWTSGERYVEGQIIRAGTNFFRVQNTGIFATITDDNFIKLAELPIEGGREGILRREFENTTSKLNYGTLLRTTQDVIDFLLGYEKYLITQGFDFSGFNKEIETIENWELSSREFLFWTTQNWSEGALLTLSPSAINLKFSRDYAVVDNIFDNFYDYTLLKADGQKLKEEFTNTLRSSQNSFGLQLKNTADGIYFLKLPLVQKEHVCLIDNKTVFNDTIYNPAPGYRQARIKILGYRTTDWNGGLHIPGFTYDGVVCKDWSENTDYNIAQVVQHKTFYYSAKYNIPGSTVFDEKDWYRLPEKPRADLVPNLDYKANQFADFYDLDTDNFDSEQQRLAQHLTGYQKRRYIENIINDDVSQYKFYQGFIQDKGTRNSLTKLFDALSNTENSSLEFFEEWAFKVGQYGASGGFEEIEYKLDEGKFRLSPQPFQLVQNINPQATDLVYRYTPSEVYSKPAGYDHAPFPTKYYPEDDSYIKTAGYVANDDVDFKVTNYDDILALDPNTIDVGKYIWVAKKAQTWDVLRQTETPFKVTSIMNSDSAGAIEIKTLKAPTFAKDTIISVLGTGDVDRFYKVINTSLNTIYVSTADEQTDLPEIDAFITELKSVRVDDLNGVNGKITRDNVSTAERVWVDHDENNRWAVVENRNKYSLAQQSYSNSIEGILGTDARNFGTSISANANNSIIPIGVPDELVNGRVDIYFRASENLNANQSQILEAPTNLMTSGENSFGQSTNISTDGKWLIVGIPYASNVKTYYKGDFSSATTYTKFDIVKYTNQYWEAKTTVEPQDPSLDYQTFDSHVQALVSTRENNLYSNLYFILRGNFSFPEELTNHVLIRAPKTQYAGTEIGDKLQLLWNNINTRYPNGVTPFNNDPIMNKAFFDGEHAIVEKVDDILLIDNTKAIPSIGETISSATAVATVTYVHTTGDNRSLIYVKDSNGLFETTGTLFVGDIEIGVFERAVQQEENYLGGWWQIAVPYGNFSSTTTIETKPYLVIEDIIKTGVTRNKRYYENVLRIDDNLTDSNPITSSWIETLTYLGDNGNVLSDKWAFRAPASFYTSGISSGGTFNFFFNEYATADGLIQSPSVISSEITHDYLNRTEHTVYDIWSGWLEINLTAFDDRGSPTIGDADYNPNYGQPFIPIVGDILQDNDTLARAEVTQVEKLFNTCRVWVKQVVGRFKYGSDNSDITSISIDGGSQGVGVVRLMGTLNTRVLPDFDGNGNPETASDGPIIVVSKGTNLVPGSTRTLQGFEYWIYDSVQQDGISRDANPPTNTNNDWKRVYNIPANSNGQASALTRQGAYAIYERNTSNFYNLYNVFVMPDAEDSRHLGATVEMVTHNDGTYTAYLLSKGNGTFEQPGRINTIKYDKDKGWILGQDTEYKGDFSSTASYRMGEYVKYVGQIYKAQTNIVPGAWNLANWTLITEGLDLNGYLPNDTGFIIGDDSAIDNDNLFEFGTQFGISSDGEVLATIVKYGDSVDSSINTPKLAIYRKVLGHFLFSQVIDAYASDIGYGSSVTVSNDGKFVAVGAPKYSSDYVNQGTVFIYESINGTFEQVQHLVGPKGIANEKFGTVVKYGTDRLAVHSAGGDLTSITGFDGGTTAFDNGTTLFNTSLVDTGELFVYELLGNRYVYADKLKFADSSALFFGKTMFINGNHIYVGIPSYTRTENNSRGTVLDYRSTPSTKLWEKIRFARPLVDLNKFKGISLFNKNTNQVTEYIDYIDPMQGKIAGSAETELTFKTTYDPATYNVATDTTVVKDETMFDTTKHVGKLWWDIDAVRFINPYSNTGNIFTTSNAMNTVFPGTQVEIYEWVESKLLPSEWDEEADTEGGLSQGISGLSKYGDKAYSTRRVYDEPAQKFETYHYYWVRNKKTVPNLPGRTISAADVQELIRDPSGAGLKFATMLDKNEWTLHNLESSITGDDTILKFGYWTIKDVDKNVHNQYKIITDGLATSVPKTDLELKWFDSLIGFDEQGRPVPDRLLTKRDMYGILNEPRQTMFVNRIEALKQLVERVNTELKKTILIDDFDLSPLLSNDPIPTTASRRFDSTIDTENELTFIPVGRLKQATINLTIQDGKVLRADVAEQGYGYKTVPTTEITTTTGSGCEITLTKNNVGQITSATVINSGTNYAQTDTIRVRPFTALTTTDSSYANKWSLYEYVGGNEPWNRIKSQRYDVSPYWSYVDWYATGYNDLTKADFVINETYELESLDDSYGSIVKINNVGSGGWLLLEKIDEQADVDYTVNYKTIGRQNATVQLAKSLYDYSEQLIGYDSFGYDDSAFDLQPIDEMRIILKALRDNIFVDELAIEYNKLFFAQMRYILSEQKFVDWMFKTSFIKAKHNIGKLRKDITFNNDFLSSYEEYVKEVKPYKSKIREYLSTYEGTETAGNMITDFDLPPVYSDIQGRIVPQTVRVVDDEIQSASSLTTYPSKHWKDNASFKLKEVDIFDAGKGYENAPGVEFVGGGGTGAKATAYVGNGKITEIKIDNPGQGYVSAPTVVLNGTVADGGRVGKVSAIIGNTNLRTTHMTVKFDRVTGTFFITTLAETETFVGTGGKYNFKLKWPLDVKTDQITVTVGGEEILTSGFTVANIEDNAGRTHKRHIGQVTFTTPPANNKTITIAYRKDVSLLTAQDRINLFYNPESGMLANDLGQLLDGIDYGGVQVKSFDFGGGSGWGAEGWFTGAYDSYDNTYEDEVIRLDGSTISVTLSKPLADGVEYNVYLNGTRIDDPNFGTAQQTNPNARTATLTGDGVQTTIFLDNDGLDINGANSPSSGDILIFRKNTSDGSFVPDPRAYDTLVTGGDLAYSTASGINPEDINIDGDGFVTQLTSKGPEEQVPGQVLDTLDMKIYDRVGSGASVIESTSYIGDGTTTVFSYNGQPQSKDALIVKIDNIIQLQSAYTVDYKNKTVTLTAPTLNQRVNVITMSGNGDKILDLDTFTGDGSTIQFVTNVDWREDINSIVTVNGEKPSYVLETTDSSYDTANKAVITFGAAPAADAVINFGIYASEAQTFSEIKTDNLVADGSSASYELSVTPFSSLPASHNIIVRVGDNILNAGYNESFIIDNRVEYQLRNWQQPGGTLGADDIIVLLNGNQLTYTSDFIFRPANSSIEIFENVAIPGAKLDIFVTTDGEYTVSGNVITLDTVPAIDTKIKVTHFSKHDIQEIDRKNLDIVTRSTIDFESAADIEYNHLLAGLIKLERQTVDAEYVWIVVNGKLQTPSVDYKVTDDQLFVRMAKPLTANDVVEIIQFAETGPTVSKFGWRVFKDMLNRTVYKRLGDDNKYRLVQTLKPFDKEIKVDNIDNMFVPDKTTNTPGVIFINGERIEYLVKDGNSLTQLRRGTFGTGVKDVHDTGSEIFDQGFQQTVPYQDKTLVNTYIGDGSSTDYSLDWTPTKGVDEFEVFAGGKRLRKRSIQMFDATLGQDSPEGDTTAQAEFSVTGSTLTLSTAPNDGVRITVVRKVGKTWNEPGKTLGKTNNAIAQFLRAEEVDLPK